MVNWKEMNWQAFFYYVATQGRDGFWRWDIHWRHNDMMVAKNQEPGQARNWLDENWKGLVYWEIEKILLAVDKELLG